MATDVENVRLAAACQSDVVSDNAIVLHYPLWLSYMRILSGRYWVSLFLGGCSAYPV